MKSIFMQYKVDMHGLGKSGPTRSSVSQDIADFIAHVIYPITSFLFFLEAKIKLYSFFCYSLYIDVECDSFKSFKCNDPK